MQSRLSGAASGKGVVQEHGLNSDLLQKCLTSPKDARKISEARGSIPENISQATPTFLFSVPLKVSLDLRRPRLASRCRDLVSS